MFIKSFFANTTNVIKSLTSRIGGLVPRLDVGDGLADADLRQGRGTNHSEDNYGGGNSAAPAVRCLQRSELVPDIFGGGITEGRCSSSELVVLLILLEQEVLAPVDSQARVSSLDQGDTSPVETVRRPAINLKIRF